MIDLAQYLSAQIAAVEQVFWALHKRIGEEYMTGDQTAESDALALADVAEELKVLKRARWYATERSMGRLRGDDE